MITAMNRAIFFSFVSPGQDINFIMRIAQVLLLLVRVSDILLTGFPTAGFLPVSGNFYFVVSGKPKNA